MCLPYSKEFNGRNMKVSALQFIRLLKELKTEPGRLMALI